MTVEVRNSQTSSRAAEPSPELTPAMRSLLPYRSHFVTIDGAQMHYLDEGGEGTDGAAKPVVLCLHGNPTWCFYYRNLIAALRPQFRVIAVDHLGCGLSDHPRERSFSSAERISHLESFVTALELTKFSLVMHDWGGPLGTGLAVRHPEKIERLLYLNTTLTEIESLPGIIRRAHMPVVGRFLTQYTRHFLKLMLEFGVSKRLTPEVQEGYLFPYQTVARRQAIWDFVADIPFTSEHPSYQQMMRIAEALPALAARCPVKIIWGLNDPCFHRGILRKFSRHFPKADIVELTDASHLVLEDRADVVIPEIAEFLRGNDRPVFQPPAEPGAVNSLYASFRRYAQQNPQVPAVIEPAFRGDSVSFTQVNFAELGERVNQYQRGLTELGLVRGDRVLMLVPAGVEFLALALAVMGRGATPVFIDPGIGREKLFRCVADADPTVMIGAPRAHILRLFKRKLFPRLKFAVNASDSLVSFGPDLGFLKKFSAHPLPEVSNDGTAFVAFTSGATGTPKGVLFTNSMVEDELRILEQVFGFKPGTKDLPLLPIFSLFHVALGVCSVFPPIDPARPLSLDPEQVVRLIRELSIRSSFGSPTLWNKISDFCVRSNVTLPSIERVLMAGAPVPEAVLQRVQGLLPNGIACTPYGATEALPVTYVTSAEIVGRTTVRAQTGELGTYVGRPVPGVALKVIAMVDGAINSVAELLELPAGQIGEVIVSGRNVSPAYLSRPDANKVGKIRDGDTVWHRMGDVGYLDANGGLYFCGRKAHLVKTPSNVFFSIPVERVFNQHARCRRSALVSLFNGQNAGIVVEPEPQGMPKDAADRERFIAELKALGRNDPVSAGIETFLFHPAFPVDARHNAKIFRDKLSEWATEQLIEVGKQSQSPGRGSTSEGDKRAA